MGSNLRRIMVEWWSFYLNWHIYIIGTAHIILSLVNQNDCRIFIFTDLFDIKREKQGEDI